MLLLPCLLAGLAGSCQSPPDLESARELRIPLIDGGGFELPFFPDADQRLGTGVPYWRGSGATLVEGPNGGHVLRLGRAGSLTQPVGLGREAVATLQMAANVRGSGALVLSNASGDSASFPFESEDWMRLEVPAAQLAALTEGWVPRFVLMLKAGPEGAEFDDVSATAALPRVAAEDLRVEALAFVDGVVDSWLAASLDDLGERPTSFAVQGFDAVTGKSLGAGTPGGVHPLFELLLELHALFGRERDTVALVAHLDDFFESGFIEGTDIPVQWDPIRDAPVPERAFEVARTLRFLLDVTLRGPLSQRERAEERARGLAQFLSDNAVLPTGEIAGVLIPGEQRMSGRTASLRRLDVPTELVRAGVVFERPDWIAVARGALSEFEFLHVWGGVWYSIDPGLDDDYGHYGARSATMALALEGDEYFGRLALSGYRYLAPIWRQTLQHGGFVAADQVRGWGVLLQVAELHSKEASQIAELLDMAVRGHWKGEQDSAGAWVDVSHHRWDPKLKLEVGDVPGAPANLIEGLGLALDERLGLDRDVLRGRLAVVLRSTVRAYGAEYELLPTRPASAGANPASGGLRVSLALLAALERL